MLPRLTPKQRLKALHPTVPGEVPKGACFYEDDDSIVLLVPNTINAEARSVRTHEALHARFPDAPNIKPVVLKQAAADWFIHMQMVHARHHYDTSFHNPRHPVARDFRATMLREIKQVIRMMESDPETTKAVLADPDQRAKVASTIARTTPLLGAPPYTKPHTKLKTQCLKLAKLLVTHAYNMPPGSDYHAERLAKHIITKMTTLNAINAFLPTNIRKLHSCLRQLTNIALTKTDQQEVNATTICKALPHINPKSPIRFGTSAYDRKQAIKKVPAEYEGHNLTSHTTIYHPQLTHPSRKRGKAPRMRHAWAGKRLSPTRLIQTLYCNAPYAPALRPTTTKSLHGTILIDASGSMGLTEEHIIAFAKAAPAATIAAYAGEDNYTERRSRGGIFILAHKGRRVNTIPRLLQNLGGNEIDYDAIRWLLTQPAPRYFITDVGFCGGAEGHTRKALQLFVEGRKTNKFTHFHTLREALIALTGTSEIEDR